MEIILSFSSLCILLLAGKALRVKVGFLRRLYLPAAVIGGLLGLLILQTSSGFIPSSCTAGWSKLPGFLINIVFAALFLGVNIPSVPTIWKKAGPQLAYGQIVAWGQYVVGLGVTMLILTPLFLVPSFFGVIIPVGFEGGHGTAAGLKATFDLLGWPQGVDYSLAAATAGIISAIVVGMVLINWAVRNNFTQKLKKEEYSSGKNLDGIYKVDQRPPAGYQTVLPSSLDSLSFHIAIIGLAVFVGYFLKCLLVNMEPFFPLLAEKKILQAFPVFPLCMVGGVIIELFFSRIIKRDVIDRMLIQRISGAALDFLVVAAIAMINLPVIMKLILPFSIIIIAAILWNVFCVVYLARRFLPDAWFERAIVELGQSMGVTATGILLLRVVDPDSETPAYYAFGYKQLLHEPFLGGGIWTSIAVPLVIISGPRVVFFISLGAVLAWTVVWWIFFRKSIKKERDSVGEC